jgi:hypothetical protein
MVVTHVFHRNGEPMRHFRRSWLRACRAAGVPGRLLHDYRRSAARNLSRAGVPERVIMQLCGWKTRSVFDRYRIVAEQDLAEGLAKLSGANTDRRRTVETIAASVRQRELLKGLVAWDGIEPPTRGFSVRLTPPDQTEPNSTNRPEIGTYGPSAGRLGTVWRRLAPVGPRQV